MSGTCRVTHESGLIDTFSHDLSLCMICCLFSLCILYDLVIAWMQLKEIRKRSGRWNIVYKDLHEQSCSYVHCIVFNNLRYLYPSYLQLDSIREMYLPRNFKICSQSCLLLVVPFGSRWGGRRSNDRSQGSDQQFWALRAGKWGKMMKDIQIIEADEKWWKIWHQSSLP